MSERRRLELLLVGLFLLQDSISSGSIHGKQSEYELLMREGLPLISELEELQSEINMKLSDISEVPSE